MPPPEPLAGFAAPVPDELELRPAKINDRFIAYALDAAPFLAGYLAMVFFLVVREQRYYFNTQTMTRMWAVWFAAYLAYQFIGHAAGGTLGKRLMGLRVVRTDGQPLGLARSFLRAAGYALSTPFFNAGFLLALVHPESRALHDLLSGSLVIEPKSRAPAESALLFLVAMGLAASMFGASIFLTLTNPTPKDIAAVEKAKEGLLVLAQIEEAYKAANGSYTKAIADLAAASGDQAKFTSAMGEIFLLERFQIQAGSKAYRITAAARDRRNTRVVLEGPPPTIK